MRYHEYNQFLTTQLRYQEVLDLMGKDLLEGLKRHLGGMPAIFCADIDVNEKAYDMAAKSFYMCGNRRGDDVIVYTRDGNDPWRKGTYFEMGGRSYLAYCGRVEMDSNEIEKLPSLNDVLKRRKEC